MYTEAAGHATQLAKEAVEKNIDIVCIIGGDGSINEVAKALVKSNTILAVIPGGSGNGFAGHLHLDRNPIKAIKQLNIAQPELIDTGLVNDHFFLNVAGIGFDALVAYKTKDRAKRGLWPYLFTSIVESKDFKGIGLEVTVDGKKYSGSYVTAVVANASIYGYGFTISPLSSVQDGAFEVVLIESTWKLRYFVEAYRFLNKSLHKSSFVKVYKGKAISIDIVSPQYMHVDGEGMETDKSLHFQINPSSLQVMVPPQEKH